MSKPTRKNFNKQVQMHLACATDPFRPATQHIWFRGGFAYATDTHILVRNRIEEISNLTGPEIDLLDGKAIHADVYREILKYNTITVTDDGIECTHANFKAFYYFAGGMNMPSFEKITQDSILRPHVPQSRISFDMQLMQQLHKALYKSEQCIATFKGTGRAIVFESRDPHISSVGLIMPIYLPE